MLEPLILTRVNSPLKDLVKSACANPGKLNLGALNPGSTQHLAAELFKSVTGRKSSVGTGFRPQPKPHSR